MDYRLDTLKYIDRLNSTRPYHEAGKIIKSLGLVFEAHLPGASVGSLCTIFPYGEERPEYQVEAEVIGFRDKRIVLMPFKDVTGISNGSLVVLKKSQGKVFIGPELLGRVVDGAMNPIDGKGPIYSGKQPTQGWDLYNAPPNALEKSMIDEPVDLGVRCVNGMITCGKGQRVGIMAGSGVGKSVLLGMFAKSAKADVNVIALIGERSREVREFIENELGEEGLKKSVVIVATSETSALLRVRSAFLAASVAEYFRAEGNNILLLMDSITRFCMAQREIGLALGEPPASKGYTPSVFALMPKLLERAGTDANGKSITGLYTVLVEGDDLDDPIGDSARSFLDGHIVLSRQLAQKNHYPAVDVLQSASRVMGSVVQPEHREWANQIREWMATYAENEDLINIGAYVKGANLRIDQAVEVHPRIEAFLKQMREDKSTMEETIAQMHSIVRAGEAFAAGQ